MKILMAFELNIAFFISTFSFQMHILHTNDIHSHFEMFSWKYQLCKAENVLPTDKRTKCFGGVARRSGFVKKFRSEHANVLLLDAGDQYQGTLWFYVYRGNLTRYFLDHMGYDAMALGSHEFDYGPKGLDPLLNDPKTQILCANLIKDDGVDVTLKENIHPHVVLSRGGFSIGIIGYITPEAVYLARTENVTFEDEIVAIQREVETLISKGVNIIIALGHSGIERDNEIAKAIPDLDIIVGGHSQTFLYNGESIANDTVDGIYPQVVNHKGSRKTLIVTAGCYGKYIGVLNVTFDSEGKVTKWSGNPVLIDENIPEDSEAKDYLKLMEVELQKLNKVIIGKSTKLFEGSNGICRVVECTLGNLFTDALVTALQELCKWSNFTLGIMNGGGIRASINEGDISCGDVMNVFPFNNKMIMATVNGVALLSAFEHSVKAFSVSKRHGKFLQVSGFKVQYNLANPNGKRVVRLQVKKCYGCQEFGDVVGTDKYEVAMPQFLADGGDGYEMFKKSKIRKYDIRDLELMMTYITKYSPITPKLEDRINGIGTFPGAWDGSVVTKSSGTVAKLNTYNRVIVSVASCFLILFHI